MTARHTERRGNVKSTFEPARGEVVDADGDVRAEAIP
jgi:hypothetical protein